MLRIIHGDTAVSPRLLEEQAFIAEVEALPAAGPAQVLPAAGVPVLALPCTVESLDGLGRLRWRAYCSTREGLLDLARELGQERTIVI